MCSLITREWIHHFVQDIECLFLKQEDIFRKVETSKMSKVRVPVRVVSEARKLSTVGKQRKDKSCLFRRGDHKSVIRPKMFPGFESQ